MEDKNIGSLSVGLKFEGFEEFKVRLNEIEEQLDRIIEKLKLIKS